MRTDKLIRTLRRMSQPETTLASIDRQFKNIYLTKGEKDTAKALKDAYNLTTKSKRGDKMLTYKEAQNSKDVDALVEYLKAQVVESYNLLSIPYSHWDNGHHIIANYLFDSLNMTTDTRLLNDVSMQVEKWLDECKLLEEPLSNAQNVEFVSQYHDETLYRVNKSK